MIKRSGEIKPYKKHFTHAKERWYKSTNLKIKLFPFHNKANLNEIEIADKDLDDDSKYVNYVSKFFGSPMKINTSSDKIGDNNSKRNYFRFESEDMSPGVNDIFNSTIGGFEDKNDLKEKLIINEEEKVLHFGN